MADFVTLSCPNCGGKLQITNDVDRFACGHCGKEQVVRRSGGIVSLAPVVQGLKQVQTGVDKTASELAIRRLQEDLQNLSARYQEQFRQFEQERQYNEINKQRAKPSGLIGKIGASSWSLTTWLVIVGIGLFCIVAQFNVSRSGVEEIIVSIVIVAVILGALVMVKTMGDSQIAERRTNLDQEAAKIQRRKMELQQEFQNAYSRIEQEIAKHKKIIEQ